MRIKISITKGHEQGYITFYRSPEEPKFYGVKEARGEKRLFRFLCNRLNELGFDLMRVAAQKDDHMLGDENQPIVRPKKQGNKGPNLGFFSGFYALRGAYEDWNKGEVCLILVMDYFKNKPDAFDALMKLADNLKTMSHAPAGWRNGDFEIQVREPATW